MNNQSDIVVSEWKTDNKRGYNIFRKIKDGDKKLELVKKYKIIGNKIYVNG